MSSIFHSPNAPRLTHLTPQAAMPGGEVDVHGERLTTPELPSPIATISDLSAPTTLARPSRTRVRVPDGAISGDLLLRLNGTVSNPLHLRVAVPMAENLNPVANPVVDADGTVYATFSGPRGDQTPVSIFRIDRDFQVRPYIRGITNATGLAFGPDGNLYCTSRAEGAVYRIAPGGVISTYAEGLGIATGLAFDKDGNLYVGDRSGTIFRIHPDPDFENTDRAPGDRPIFVFATLEPSISAYHLAFNDAGTLFVTGPTTSSHQSIHAIAPDGATTTFFRGLGRAQGLAFDRDNNLYVAASLHGQRGIIRITPGDPTRNLPPQASLAVAGNNLVGLAFLEDGCATLATRDSLFHLDLGIEGRKLP